MTAFSIAGDSHLHWGLLFLKIKGPKWCLALDIPF